MSDQIKTADQYRRTVDALTETTANINREMAYPPHLRDSAFVAQMSNHAEKLMNMIMEWKQR